MADQAQGLRALVNQARRDHNEGSFPADSDPNDTCVPSRPVDVLNPGADSQLQWKKREALPITLSLPVDTSNLSEKTTRVPLLDTGLAAVDARHHAPASASSVPNGAPTLRRNLAPTDTRVRNSPSVAGRVARVIAITSGKGGVGKTNFCSNLALSLAATGQRVIVVDADLGLANLHVVLGVAPRFHLEHVMRGEKSLKDVLYPGPGGIHIIGGGSGLTDMANLDEARRQRFVQSLSELDTLADIVLLDTGAGLSHNVLAFLCAVDEVIVVTTPEPTAITDAYATIKVLSQENPNAQQRLVINMAQSEAEARAVAERLQNIAQRFLQRDLSWLGYLPHDMTVSKAVRAQQPFTLLEPTAPVSRAIAQIASQLGYESPAASPGASGVNGLLTRMQRFFGLRAPGA